jgi:23S rRNA (adenine-N6)-dimethyltransferase
VRASSRSLPPKSWGWHALTGDWPSRIVAQAGVRPGDLVLDIGAGYGALTAPLVAAGARVLAIELHAGRAEHLRHRFRHDPVTVVEVDAAGLLLPHRPFKVVANPPFAISSALLQILLGRRSQLVSAELVLQRALVSRLITGPHGRWQVKERLRLPRSAFHPRPQVDTAVAAIRPIRR